MVGFCTERPSAQALPELSDRLAHIEPFVGTPEEADAVRQAYELIPRANFSKHVLEVCPDAGPSGVGADAGPVGLIGEAPRPAARQAEAATRETGRSGGEVSVTWILQ